MTRAQDRTALIVGIDYYKHLDSLRGCVNDATNVARVLSTNGDDERTTNFRAPKVLKAADQQSAVDRDELKDAIKTLFAAKSTLALLYFAGHGHIEATGGYICASNTKRGDEGLPLGEIMTMADASPALNRIIILDSCNSGILGSQPSDPRVAAVKQGTTILTASTESQYASEANGYGVFTDLLIDALEGAASNLVGDITPGGVYAHIDESLADFGQRPVFKTNVENFVSLRRVKSPVSLQELRQLKTLFPQKGFNFKLDPSFEKEHAGRPADAPPPDLENTKVFETLQRLNRVNLLVPVDAPHMWHAAIESKSCRLTALGEHYRRLVEQGLI